MAEGSTEEKTEAAVAEKIETEEAAPVEEPVEEIEQKAAEEPVKEQKEEPKEVVYWVHKERNDKKKMVAQKISEEQQEEWKIA